MSYFGKTEVPEAQELGICRFFRDLAVGHGPGAGEGPRTPKIEVSDPKNEKVSNRIIGLHNNFAANSTYEGT